MNNLTEEQKERAVARANDPVVMRARISAKFALKDVAINNGTSMRRLYNVVATERFCSASKLDPKEALAKNLFSHLPASKLKFAEISELVAAAKKHADEELAKENRMTNKIAEDKARLADEAKGFSDRNAGHYDKWYRYARSDEGAAYDRGCARAVDEGKCPEDFEIIECVSAMLPKY